MDKQKPAAYLLARVLLFESLNVKDYLTLSY